MRKSLWMILGLALLVAGSQICSAATITLISSGGGVYDYGIELNVGESVQFNQNQGGITLSGLSGVTGASVSGTFANAGFSVLISSPNSVTFTETAYPFAVFGNSNSSGTATIGTLVVDSSVLTTGTVNYAFLSSSDVLSTGITQGPVAAAPEPSSVALLGMGLLALSALGVLRKRKAVVTG